jgi:hypothetical protein
MESKKYLKLFVDTLERCRKLSDAEFGRLIRAALAYKATGGEVSLEGREELLWDGMKLDIDRDNEAYDARINQMRENGLKGGRPRKPNGFSENQKNQMVFSESKKSQDKDKDKDEDRKEKPPYGGQKKSAHFSAPSVADVMAYCAERKNSIDPERFVDYYEARGWMIGKNPMKSWKAAVRTWEKNQNGGVDHAVPDTTGRGKGNWNLPGVDE